MKKYTKGPWRVTHITSDTAPSNTDVHTFEVYTEKDAEFANKISVRNERSLANMQLISKAPIMHELLDDVDTAFATLSIGSDHGITPQARAAINEIWPKVREIIGRDKNVMIPKG